MTDAKKLDQLLDIHPDDWDANECHEVYRLARLGLWAEEHAIPAITHYAKDGSVGSHTSGHGESSDHISFYNGLKIESIDVLAHLPDADTRYPKQVDKA